MYHLNISIYERATVDRRKIIWMKILFDHKCFNEAQEHSIKVMFRNLSKREESYFPDHL